MSEIRARLLRCFRAVFPAIPQERLPELTTDGVQSWDSLATATLISVIQEEFTITLHSEELEQLDSFAHFYEYVLACEKQNT